MKNKTLNLLLARSLLLLALTTCNLQPTTAFAQGTAFTYQGRLNNGANLASGIYDLQFAIYDSTNSPGTLIAGPLTNSATAVSNGLFTVTLDFGAGVFNGANRALDIAVRTNGATAFTTLSPRQQILPTPYAFFASTAGSATAASTAASVPASGIGSGTANINISGSALSAAYAGTAVAANIAATATTAGTATNLIGNVSDAQIPANLARLNGTNNFTGTNTFANVVIATNVNNVIAGVFTGNGGGLTNLNTAQFANSVLTNGETGLTLGGTFNGNATTATTANNFSGSLSGDVTGTQGATFVANVGGQSAANIASGVSAANAATSANSASTIVKRDASGNLSASTITANLTGNATTATTANNFSGSLSGDVTGTQSATAVASVGGQTAANVAGGANAANAATSANTASTIVKRDASGNFSADAVVLTGNLYLPATTASAGIIYAGGTPLIQSYGIGNIFTGSGAGNLTMSGIENTASGYEALNDNTSGSFNTANGVYALTDNTNGSGNTAVGHQAISANQSGSYNTAVGYQTLWNSNGSNNIALGYRSGYNVVGSSNIDIGNVGVSSDNNIIRIGSGQTSTFIAGSMQMSGNVVMNDNDIQFRNDSYHGVGWYGGGKLFGGVNVNGPVLYGGSGGGLGCTGNGNNLALAWTSSGVTVNGTFNNNSDRNAKQNFASVKPEEVLAKVAQLPVMQWSYKTDAATRHIGPMAQDFYAAFAVGTDERHIAPIDEGGVALAAIQGLNEKLEARSQKLEAENAELKAQMAELKALVQQLAQPK